MTKTNKYYITTTAPYVNGKPHIGFALEIIQADALARHKRLQEYDVFFNFGTDEHGQKIYKRALEAGKNPQKYTDEYASQFEDLKKTLNLSYDNYTRTTDPEHKKAAQHFWRVCSENGFITKGIYKAKYCVGCELEKQDSELEDNKCPLHPSLEIEHIEEENYFFKFSSFQEKLLTFYKNNPKFIVPEHRQKEIQNFVSAGLKDFSISRLKEKMPWGVHVPDDENHVMYVWFDALTYYISSLGWPTNLEKFNKFWGTIDSPNAIQVAGKDNLRQQSAMWQAMLMAAGLPTTKQILIHGFINSAGQRMSKSLGNVIDPFEYVNDYGTDALRYYLLAKVSPTEDSDFTRESFEQAYQSDLANGLGNLVSRVCGMTQKYFEGIVPTALHDPQSHSLFVQAKKSWGKVNKNMESYEFNLALGSIWQLISAADKYINETKPWELAKSGNSKELEWVIYGLCDCVSQIAWQLAAFLPDTANQIAEVFGISGLLRENPVYSESLTNIKQGTKLKPSPTLFPRLD